MLKHIKYNYYLAGAAFTLGLLSSGTAHAQETGGGSGTGLNNLFDTVTEGLANFPKMIGVIAYLFGVVFTILGIFKIKQHVEEPQQNPLQQGAIRLIAGGALFAFPTIMEAAQTLFDTSANVQQQAINPVDLL